MGFPLFALVAAATATLSAVVLGAAIGHRAGIARRAGALAAALVLAYAGVLAAVNASTSARVLRPGEPQALCGAYLDCHIGLAVSDSEPVPGQPVRLVTLELSSGASAATLTPPNLAIHLIDGDGRIYNRNLDAETYFGLNTALDQPLEPGARRTVRLAFAVPDGVSGPRLRVRLAEPVTRMVESVLVGDADGLFHAPVLHALDT